MAPGIFLGMLGMFLNWIVVMTPQYCEHGKIHLRVYFSRVNFPGCVLSVPLQQG
jgi:hypothetical protein